MRLEVFLGLTSTVLGTDLVAGTVLECVGSCALGLALGPATQPSDPMSTLLGDIYNAEGLIEPIDVGGKLSSIKK